VCACVLRAHLPQQCHFRGADSELLQCGVAFRLSRRIPVSRRSLARSLGPRCRRANKPAARANIGASVFSQPIGGQITARSGAGRSVAGWGSEPPLNHSVDGKARRIGLSHHPFNDIFNANTGQAEEFRPLSLMFVQHQRLPSVFVPERTRQALVPAADTALECVQQNGWVTGFLIKLL
jgi:hypothetical protein